MGISQQIATFAINTRRALIPESARNIARLSLIDWIAVAIAGRDEPVSRIVRQMLIDEGGSPQASIIGSRVKLSARAAALCNGTTSHALDYDDTHFIYLGHPSVAVIPAAMAMAEKIGLSSIEDFIDACLIGSEVACRVGAWLGREHYELGFHATATAGSFGATAAACRLLELSVGQTTHALGLCATRSSGIKAQFGTMGKPYHAGMAASNGVEVATLAAGGFCSNPDAIDTLQGFSATHAGEANNTALWDELGSDYIFETVQHKFHACCHGTHAMLEALREARDGHGINASNTGSVLVTVHPRYLNVCNITQPKTGLECKFSLRMAAAMALAGYDTSREETFSDAACKNPLLLEICNRVTVSTDDTLSETMAQLRVNRPGQIALEISHDLNRAVGDELREAKLHNKAKGLLGEDRANRIWTIINSTNSSFKPLINELVNA